ncbi:hypothetical protein [Arthrobacter sp. ZBG10]|uniref:hypothetical protein n=1 Tax=Arthrobacter sp. ZBG10 TaxID=1676590 RepID=UPI0012F8CAF4|nr:hypothetical protein [Arthrobacter sp. ZBG10]
MLQRYTPVFRGYLSRIPAIQRGNDQRNYRGYDGRDHGGNLNPEGYFFFRHGSTVCGVAVLRGLVRKGVSLRSWEPVGGSTHKRRIVRIDLIENKAFPFY